VEGAVATHETDLDTLRVALESEPLEERVVEPRGVEAGAGDGDQVRDVGGKDAGIVEGPLGRFTGERARAQTVFLPAHAGVGDEIKWWPLPGGERSRRPRVLERGCQPVRVASATASGRATSVECWRPPDRPAGRAVEPRPG